MATRTFRQVAMLLCVVGYLLLAAPGCATHAKRLVAPRAAFYANDLPGAKEEFESLAKRPGGDEAVLELDLALIDLFEGKPQAAEDRLRSVRDAWEHLEQQSLGEEAASMLADDQARQYSGEDYEKLLIRVFLTLSSLMQDGVDAESYSLQTLSLQQELQRDAHVRWPERADRAYCFPAIAPYLRGVLREATLRNYDDALRSYEQTLAVQPDAGFVADDIQRVSSGVHSRPGHGVVYVLALVGEGPYKRESRHRVTQEALLVADRILSSTTRYQVPPTLAPVKIPEIVCPPKPFDLLGVEVDGTPVSTTLPLTDLNRLAVDSYQAQLPEIIGRAAVRRIIKKGAVYTAKDQLHATSNLASLAFDAAGVLWEASESADTRCWGLLPREIQVLRLELPRGRHQLHLEPVTAGRPVAAGRECLVDVVNGQNTYVLSYWPDRRPVGQILVSQGNGSQ